jgi:hypothetical protein
MNDAGVNFKYCPWWRDSKFIGPLNAFTTAWCTKAGDI